MAVLRTSLRNAIFTALLSIFHLTQMTRTAGSYGDQAANLADGALQHWDKRLVKWEFVTTPANVPQSVIVSGIEFACGKWAEHMPIRLRRAAPNERPDIRITMVRSQSTIESAMPYPKSTLLDNVGVDIEFNDSDIWTTADSQRWRNFKFFALYEIGHALGLGTTDEPSAVMHGWRNPASRSRRDPELAWDDIYGVQKKYGDRNGNFIHGRLTFGGRDVFGGRFPEFTS